MTTKSPITNTNFQAANDPSNSTGNEARLPVPGAFVALVGKAIADSVGGALMHAAELASRQDMQEQMDEILRAAHAISPLDADLLRIHSLLLIRQRRYHEALDLVATHVDAYSKAIQCMCAFWMNDATYHVLAQEVMLYGDAEASALIASVLNREETPPASKHCEASLAAAKATSVQWNSGTGLRA